MRGACASLLDQTKRAQTDFAAAAQESGPRHAPAALLTQLAAAHANAAAVVRSVRQLQRQLPAALAGLRRRFETYDADADDGDDLEDAYEELCRLDAQGITAQVRPRLRRQQQQLSRKKRLAAAS